MIRIDADTEKLICESYGLGNEVKQICCLTKLDRQSIYKVLWRNNVVMRSTHKGLSKLKDEICRKYYKGLSANALAKEYGTSITSVSRILRLNDVRIRTFEEQNRFKYPLKDDVFDKLTPQSSYWLGLLMADGCIKRNSTVSLTLKERNHIEMFRQFLGAACNKISENRRTCTLNVTSTHLTDSLRKYGVTPRKSFTAKVAKCLEFDVDFWRGMVDGDGYVTCNGRFELGLCGSWDCCNKFKNFIHQILPKCSANVNKMKTIWSYKISGKQVALAVGLLYGNACVALPRKLAIAKRIISSEPGMVQQNNKEQK